MNLRIYEYFVILLITGSIGLFYNWIIAGILTVIGCGLNYFFNKRDKNKV